MHIYDVLPADGIDLAELVMATGKELVEGVGAAVAAIAACDVESKERSWREARVLERVPADGSDRVSSNVFSTESAELIVELNVDVERPGSGRKARA